MRKYKSSFFHKIIPVIEVTFQAVFFAINYMFYLTKQI